MAAQTWKGNSTGSTAQPQDVTTIALAAALSSAGIGGSGQNFITNGNAEVGATTGWATYNDGTAKPVDGTGGTVTNLTLGVTATNPIMGTESFQVVKAAANIQGEGISYDFTIDENSLARIQQVSFPICIVSGAMAQGDWTLWIYDKTNGVMIQPVAYQFPSAVVGANPLIYTVSATFQTNINSTSYRLIMHCATTSASALTWNFDNVNVGPQSLSYGSPDSDWVAYTPATQGFGTITNSSFFWRRVGDSCQIRGLFTSGTVSAVMAQIGLPGLTIDSTKLSSSSPAAIGVAYEGVTANQCISALGLGGTTYIGFGGDGTNYLSQGNANAIFNSSANISFEATVPILGWSSAVRVSQPDATRTVAFRAHLASNQTGIGTSSTQVQIATVDEDTHGQYGITAYSYVIPVAGYYNFSYLLLVTSVTAAAGYIAYITKNGTQIGGTSEYVASSSGNYISGLSESLSFSCNAADVITIYSNSTAGTFTILSGAYFCGHRIAGPERIAASEKVLADYNNTSTPTIGTSQATISSGWTKVTDTHGAFSNGVFTAPRAGLLRIEASLFFTNIQVGNLFLIQAGSSSRTIAFQDATSTSLSGAKTISVQAGDTITVQCQAGSTSTTLISAAGYNNISFTME